MVYIISGVAFTGNKGASGMAEAIIQNLSSCDLDNRFYVYTYYPRQDAKANLYDNVTILDATPKAVVINFFLVLWSALCILLKLPGSFYKKHRLTNAILESDYWLDTSGISFVDGREKFLIYNILSILPALMLKRKIVKMPQALGPFNNRINRWCSSLILPKIALICSRGRATCRHLEQLGLKNYSFYPDIAFSLKTSPQDRQAVEGYIEDSPKRIIGISPSQVVYGLCQKKGINYLNILKGVTEELIKGGCKVVVFAHSIRTDTQKTHNNDLPLLIQLAQILGKNDDIRIVDKDLTASQLRELIGSFDTLIASRFHALISAICTSTPVITLGWSHKYDEVLEEFGISDYSVKYNEISEGKLLALVEKAQVARDDIALRIENHLPQVKEQLKKLYSSISGKPEENLNKKR